jgi:hypothetical protein
VQIPVCKIKSGKKHKRFKREYLHQGRECFVKANIHYPSKLFSDRCRYLFVKLKVGKSASALRENTFIKVENVS